MKQAGKTLVLGLLFAAATAQPALAAFPGSNGKIVVASYVNVSHFPGDPDIKTLNPDGTGATYLTTDHRSSLPAWSPDGSKIAFNSGRDGDFDIYTMKADGSGVVQLTNDPASDGNPAWSPDGSRIVFVSYRTGDGDLYVMNADGTGVARLTTDPATDGAPAWSPDGNEIAFSRHTPGTSCCDYTNVIYAIAADGTGERQIVGDPALNPNWSPDGSKIVFDDRTNIWVVNADGTGALQVTSEQSPNPEYIFLSDGSPAWSPDGSKIAFAHSECGIGYCGSPELETVNPDGTGRTGVISNGGEPDWQPKFGYARPVSASPVQLRFVPAHHACADANAVHGSPLASPSCNPPQPASDFLTVGGPDSNGAAAQFQGSALIKAICNPPAPGPRPPCTAAGDQADAQFQLSFTDVRQKTTLLDYTGELEATVMMRITDKDNGALGQSATATDVPFSFAVPCASTTDPAIGSTCSVTTTANSILPGIAKEGKRAVWGLGQFQIFDGGGDGDADTAGDNTLFAVQGLFAP